MVLHVWPAASTDATTMPLAVVVARCRKPLR
jgi:hypothetical protein